MSEQAAVTSKGIQELLKSYRWEEAVCEYVWNGFDAGATEVQIEFEHNPEPLDTLKSLAIIDNGTGIPRAELKSKFKPIYESEKAGQNNQPKNHSLPHGRNGKGRLTFFTFATGAEWETHYFSDSALSAYGVKITADDLDQYTPYEMPVSQESTGIRVRFAVFPAITKTKIEAELVPYIRKEFSWFLELKKHANFCIKINGVPLEYEEIIVERDTFTLNEHSKNERFDIRFVLWHEKQNGEYSKYYFLDGSGNEVWKHNTTLNNKGDNFYHSVFIASSYFDTFLWAGEGEEVAAQVDMFATQKSETYKDLMSTLADFLHKKRNPYIDSFTERLVSDYDKEGIFPVRDSSLLEVYRKDALKETVRELYKVQPKIFSSLNTTQKKAFIGLLDALLELGADDRLLEIIAKLVDMTPAERSELAQILEYASMSAITRTIGLIKDRMKVVLQLRELVLDESWGADESHIQTIVENHYWLFGEQFNLTTAEEPDFEEALRCYTHLLRGDGETRKPRITHPDKNKEMDIFMTRKIVSHDRIENIVVELKHPTVKLGRKELNQIDTYMGVIASEPRFSAQNMYWKFILVGKSFDTSDAVTREYENSTSHGERYLVKKISSIRCSHYVMRWCDIFLEFECKHNHLMAKLELNKTKMMEELRRHKTAAESVSSATKSAAAETATWSNPAAPIGSLVAANLH